jgi:hypothetical protein
MKHQIASSSKVQPRVSPVNRRPYTNVDITLALIGDAEPVSDHVRLFAAVDGPFAPDFNLSLRSRSALERSTAPIIPSRQSQNEVNDPPGPNIGGLIPLGALWPAFAEHVGFYDSGIKRHGCHT